MAITTTAAILGSAAIGAGASLFGASQQASAADKATSAQVQSQRDNIAFQKDIFGQQKEALAPWQTAGLDALKRIQTGISDGSFDLSKYGYQDLVQDPGYQFRLSEGTNALERAAAARGKFISGDQLRDVTAYGQGMASQEFGNAFARAQAERDTRFNMSSSVANMGYGAATALSGVAGQLGDKVGNAQTNIGNAQAQGSLNAGNVWANLGTNLATTANRGIENILTYRRLQGT